jgi:hypothetical protein
MKRLAFLLIVAAAALPAAAPGAGCSPLNCAPSQFSLAGGKLLGFRPAGIDGPVRVLDLVSGQTRWDLPAGVVSGHTLVHADGDVFTWFDTATGTRLGSVVRQAAGAFSLVGASQDGVRAVLSRTQKKSTTFAILWPAHERLVQLAGRNWGFDALSGSNLYLLRYLKNGYQVRVFDLAQDRLLSRPLKDPHESALIWGSPWARVTSADGRYLFTLYVGGNGGTMIHELDVRSKTARCIDLPGTGDFNSSVSYAMLLSPDGKTLWALSPGYGRVVAIDVVTARVRASFRLTFRPINGADGPTSSVGTLSRDGKHAAVGTGNDVWVVDLATRRVVLRRGHVALALGFSPDGRTLWGIGQKSRVFSLPLIQT